MVRRSVPLASLLLAGCLHASPAIPDAPTRAAEDQYETVILNGRVMDPESGLDAVRNVGISGGVVRAVTDRPIDGTIRIDAHGMVVAPGFIDLHQHAHTLAALHAKALDGVTTLTSPLTMIVSDGVLESGAAHPRIAGTYARVLGRYVREQRLLTLMDALRKMTLMPAQRLEARAPAMRNKGRLRVGADADITIFDPATVGDAATYAEPLLPSRGIRHVLVGGMPVVSDGRLDASARPGKAVRAGH